MPDDHRDAVPPTADPATQASVTPSQRPDPEPLQTDEVRVILVGTLAFAAGLVVTLVAHDRLAAHGNGDWVWIMVCGVLLGLLGLWVVSRRRDALRRAVGDVAAPSDDSPGEGAGTGDPSTTGTLPNQS